MVFGDTMRAGHSVDMRFLFPPFLTRKRLYFVLVAGRDRRGDGRAGRAGRWLFRVFRRLVKILAIAAAVAALVLAALFFLA